MLACMPSQDQNAIKIKSQREPGLICLNMIGSAICCPTTLVGKVKAVLLLLGLSLPFWHVPKHQTKRTTPFPLDDLDNPKNMFTKVHPNSAQLRWIACCFSPKLSRQYLKVQSPGNLGRSYLSGEGVIQRKVTTCSID